MKKAIVNRTVDSKGDVKYTIAPSRKISLIGLDNQLPIGGKLFNRFSAPDFSIREVMNGKNTWYEIRGGKSVIMVPLVRIAYLIYEDSESESGEQ